MKNIKRSLPILQFEFGYSADCFRLIQEVALDGERLACERAESTSDHFNRKHSDIRAPEYANSLT
jgi:hypothetical protein